MKTPLPTPVYHLTHWLNLPSIISSNALLSHHEMCGCKLNHQSIAFEHIQERRESTTVPCAQGGGLHDYVPFHFAPKSPMLFTISKGNVPACKEGQRSLIYLVSSAQDIMNAGIPFVFTDGHATMAFTEWFDDLARLDRVDWQVMGSQYWNDTPAHPDRKRRRQAEFLVYKKLPVSLISEIAVIDEGMQGQVQNIMSGSTLKLPVQVRRNWYY